MKKASLTITFLLILGLSSFAQDWKTVKIKPIISRNIRTENICSGEWFVRAKADRFGELTKTSRRRIKKSAYKHGCKSILVDVFHKFSNVRGKLYVLGVERIKE